MTAQFRIKPADPAVVARIQQEFDMPSFIAQTLAARGFETTEAVACLLEPSLERDWRDPYEIPGLDGVVDALEEALLRDDHILVFGDFDLDGISATTVLTRGLREFGARVTPFIPRRFEEGYGLSEAAVARACSLNPDLIVTVDCGISCKDEVARLLEMGMRVVITDHHEAAEQVPVGVPLADPKTSDDCPSAILAGVGVALKVVQALGGRRGKPHFWRELTDFATLGTIADLMPMTGENRALVADGLARMNGNPRPCIAALLATSGASEKAVTSTNLGFSLVPRLNAPGRLGNAQLALDVLLSDEFEEASTLAAELEHSNETRRAIELELSEIAKSRAVEVYHGQRALVVAGEGWHEGVKGIVASRLVGIYGVPAILLTIDGDEARGSGRSVGQVNLFKAVESTADLLSRFGGHEAAVGITLPVANLPEFERRLCAYMETLPPDDFHPRIDIDASVSVDELTLEAIERLESLAPFGQEYPVPRFLAQDVTLMNCKAVGAEKNHFSCQLSNGRGCLSAIMFHCPDIEALMNTDSVVNAAFEAQIDEWRGRRTVKAMLKALSPARLCEGLRVCLNEDTLNFMAKLYDEDESDDSLDPSTSLAQVEEFERARVANRAIWHRRALENPAQLEAEVVRALIGDNKLHQAQRAILDNLNAGLSTCAVMATGRGKSLTFQVHAAMRALTTGQVSLFVYPLRALIADQAFHLRNALNRFGISISVLTGESSPEERERIFRSLNEGSVDVILTTPEFLSWHVDEFAVSGRIGFVVADEAHHISLARAGQREAYAHLGDAVRKLGPVTVLALTATANDSAVDAICRELPISRYVFDRHDRANLLVDDHRNARNRDDYLAYLVAQGDKTLIFVNSRESSVSLARFLRRHVPQLAPMIGFYNAGLSREERTRIEELFRTGHLNTLVATSAFGEGVNIPDVRRVVLYHLPFNEIEFNQMSGRVGRDGKESFIHLLFNYKDGNINERILYDTTPDHDSMAQIYRTLRTAQRQAGTYYFELDDSSFAAQSSTELCPITAPAVACGVAVFRELGLIEAHSEGFGLQMKRSVHVAESANKVDLADSVRYREGLDEQRIFRSFRNWILDAAPQDIVMRVSRPILPEDLRGGHVI